VKNKITRRDFLNGTRIAIGASLVSPFTEVFGAQAPEFSLGADYYPPELTGMRGSHDGSWEIMHARVAGRKWSSGSPEEEVDLVIVGAGISGLAAAHFFTKERRGARVLLLDNHDDFGGHAKRNEFRAAGRTLVGYGGTESIDTPSSYSDVAKDLLIAIGIDVQRFYEYFDQKLYDELGLSYAILFDQEHFEKRKLVAGYGSRPWREFAAAAPLSDKARADLVRAFTDERDYLPEMSVEEKRRLLANTSYLDYLKNYVKVDDQILEIYRRWGMSFWCVGMDEVPALSVPSYDDGGGMPGLKYTMPRVGHRGDEPYIFHFPDGNASVARLLVRSLLPDALPGSTMEDVVTAKLDYSKLDGEGASTRIRLNSTAVNVAHADDKKSVLVTYVHKGKAHTVRASRCILACYNSAIPYLCPELPEEQRKGLSYNVKVPLTYTKVQIRSWRAFADLGIRFVYYTGDFFKQVELDYPVSIGKYEFGKSPDEPMVVHMCYVPFFADIRGPDQWREGRRTLLRTSFATFEEHVRDQLDQALSKGGFDADRDIQAITVNRWPHGYSYSPGLLWEPEWPDEESQPWVIGRRPFGRIAIANSDAGASADTNSAITHGYRAVQESL
jgi:spermidine dehydrogenase